MMDGNLSTFNLYYETGEMLSRLDDPEQIGRILLKVLRTSGIDGDVPELSGIEEFAYQSIKGQMLRYDRKRCKNAANGERGGRPSYNPNETQQEPSHNPNETTNTNTNRNTNRNTNTNTGDPPPLPPSRGGSAGAVPKTKRKPGKVQFAEFVSMTNDEHSSLVARFGEQGAGKMVEILDNYKGANGKKYKSDYHAILNWVVKRYEEEQTQKGRSREPPDGNGFYDMLRDEYAWGGEQREERQVASNDP